MAASEQPVSFEQIKGAIGSLVLLWSQIERELAAAIRRLSAETYPIKVHGISISIDAWSKRVIDTGRDRPLQTRLCQKLAEWLKKALHIRNAVCHGLVGISGQIHRAHTEAHLVTELCGCTRILTWSELQELFSWMSRAPWMIHRAIA